MRISERLVYCCPSCGGADMSPVGTDPQNKGENGKPQLIFQCRACQCKSGENALLRAARKLVPRD